MATPRHPYPIPVNEDQRLQAVQALGLIGSPPDRDLDALCRVAAHTFGVPAAVISLIEAEQQHYLARVGVDVAELGRHESPCAHAIMAPEELLVVRDTLADPSWAAHPLVTDEPYLRFYAGASLLDPDGLPVGTLALLDTAPHADFSASQQDALLALAQVTGNLLESRRQQRELRHQAATDPLTGLANRAQFQRALEVELAQAMRTGEPFTLVYMDLDGFRDIRDGFGLAAGDEVLREVARRLQQQVRLGDVLARFGSDEFGVVMRHGGEASAEILARRIIQAVSAPIALGSGDTVGVGISVGMAAYSDATESVATLQQQAEQALQEARRLNAQRWQMFAELR